MRVRALVTALAAAALLLASGCGSGTAPAEDVPALATSLDAVDEAVESGDDAAVRDAVADLTEVTTSARDAGDLDAAAADRILAAAEALVAALRESAPPTEDERSEPPTPESPTPESPAPETPSPEPTSDDDEDDQGQSEGKGEGKGKDKPDKEDKEKD